MEFAFTLPIVLALGGYGIECSFLALSNLRVSQFALTLADNASRVGLAGNAGVTSLREADINDVFQGTRLESQSVNLAANGRVTLTSLENVAQTYSDHAAENNPVQRIHWQRCLGVKSGAGFDSVYPTSGTLTTTSGTDTTYANRGVDVSGVGSPVVTAPANGGVMFVEVNYQYKPAFAMFGSPQIIHYAASFIVRDNRDFTHISNPSPTATPATCNLHNS